MHHLRIQPSEVEALPYYEYHYIVKELSDMLKEQQKGQDRQSEQMNDQMNGAKMQQPKLPKMQDMKMPSIKMPKL